MNLQGRMVGAVMILTVLTLGLAFAVIFFSVNRSQQRQLDDALLAEAQEEAREIAAIGGTQLTISDRPGPAANDVGPLTKYGALYGRDHSVIAATPTWTRGAPRADALPDTTAAPFDLRAGREHLRAVLVGVPGLPGLRLLLAAPRTDLDGDATFLRNAMLMVLLVAFGWTLAVTTWFARRLTRGHARIMEVAHRAAGGDLSVRVAELAVAPDVSQLGRDLDETLSRLEFAVDAQRRFIAHAAHELRSPITALLGEITFTLRRDRSAQDYRTALEEALDATERLRVLSDDLLTLARLGAGSETEFGEVSLRAVVDAAVADVTAASRERALRIARREVHWRVNGHANDLRRLVRNLVENAARHCPKDEEIRIDCWADSRSVFLAVDDAGEGVSAEERDRIFEPFFRGATTRAEHEVGTGLGLAIARAVARQHHGELSCEVGARGRGARFVLRLPGPTPKTSPTGSSYPRDER